ncbi:MAG: bifunctional UDP-N-acetylglucosamine diphosphorylase/glucosamine-1-phosphate N-acetyltransferase GlmU, partial [Magnetococcales bacterium]|nr:bifunctional UDP-N-acetylglucosamine diphosphorylase/glucosamine-1-phosphate N-acetyltransferase GlmU [Magnetococcales bacterium]
MSNCAILILAAGQGTRMRSALPKVLHPLAGRPLLGHVLRTARHLQPARLAVVIGHQAERIQAAFPDPDITWVRQEEQLGTAHAVRCALPALADLTGELLILSGDTPLVESTLLEALLREHRRRGVGVTLLSTRQENPTGYGRVIRDEDGELLRVVEEKDASAEERAICEINSGIYCVDLGRLAGWLAEIADHNAQREYYLPDLIAIAKRDGEVGILHHPEAAALAGVNDRRQLAALEVVLRDRLVAHWQSQGVTFTDPSSCWLAADVIIGQDSVIAPQVILGEGTLIGPDCHIGPFCEIRQSHLGAGCQVKGFCHLEGAVLEGGSEVGPYARLRPGTQLATGAKVGNFCEIKKSHIGAGSKVNHLSYIGDTQMGKGVNVGAGTITCNYDGVHKHQTIIEDGVFIGSDSQLVAPVRIG